MVKHGQAVGAWEHYNQMLGIAVEIFKFKSNRNCICFFLWLADGFQPDLMTYNSILKISGIIREDGEYIITLIDVSLSLKITKLQNCNVLVFSGYSYKYGSCWNKARRP